MPSKDPQKPIKYAYWNRLQNTLGVNIEIYKDAVPIDITGNYVLIRGEGNTSTELNNSAFFRSSVIIVEIVTKFATMANSTTAHDISEDVQSAILTNTYEPFMVNLADFIITQITLQSEDEIYEDDGAEKIFRIVQRYENTLTQK
jgi:L-asparaginase II